MFRLLLRCGWSVCLFSLGPTRTFFPFNFYEQVAFVSCAVSIELVTLLVNPWDLSFVLETNLKDRRAARTSQAWYCRIKRWWSWPSSLCLQSADKVSRMMISWPPGNAMNAVSRVVLKSGNTNSLNCLSNWFNVIIDGVLVYPLTMDTTWRLKIPADSCLQRWTKWL